MKARRSGRYSPVTVMLTTVALGLTVSQACAGSAGERIARQGASHPGAVACSSCHAVDGGGNKQSGFPRLAGLKPVSHAQAPAGIPVSAGEKLANYGDMTTRGPERVSQGGPGLNYVPDL